MALPYVSVSASANNSTIYVTGHFHNNGSTWQDSPGCRFTLSIDGIGNIYDQRHTFNGNSFDFSASRGVGTSYNNRTYTVHAWWDSSGFHTEQIMRPQLSQYQPLRDRHTQYLIMPMEVLALQAIRLSSMISH